MIGTFIPNFLNVKINLDERCETISGLNQMGERFYAIFKIPKADVPKTFDVADLIVGNTIVILYAQLMNVEKYTRVYIDSLKSVFIFKAGIDVIKVEAGKFLNDATCIANNELQSCFGCGSKTTNLSKCANCMMAKYCSKVKKV